MTTGTVDPNVGLRTREYVTVAPSIAGNPETGLTATVTIQSPLPIGSPNGPRVVSVPAQLVKTAAQQNADELAAAQGMADQYNALQQQAVAAATASAFGRLSAAIEASLKAPPYTAANFYIPLTPPVPGAVATSEDATTWTLSETVYLVVGRVVHDQVRVSSAGLPIYGPDYCSELTVVDTTPPSLNAQVATTVPAFTTQTNQIADALWQSFRRGAIVSEPANGSPTYVGLPTCVALDTGLPTGSRTPNPFTLSLPLTLRGVAGSLPVAVSGRVAVSIVANGVHWDFHDPSGDTTVHGQDSTDPTAPNGTPTYDAASGTWPDAAAKCAVYHQYRALASSPGVNITASEHFHIEVSGVYSNGSAAPVTFAYKYEPQDSPVVWAAGPYPIYQIEAVPYAPTG
ncbi:MAG: hypothetical protein DLM65_13910 [Candidatus Aeolococcus gillhamiae]|uniref:Uncharacterized protein n=1 Tax=Candidatus Aeolococcus gillhamiae TaxID=3127015 RepID=A0A2W5YYX2_9BACT|nr:MAG: hypothetical protein DLM65_13910 [Candidatus Dormibacter sp. RRmetagenome_bin12]